MPFVLEGLEGLGVNFVDKLRADRLVCRALVCRREAGEWYGGWGQGHGHKDAGHFKGEVGCSAVQSLPGLGS